jgi:hypothetical protein
MALRYRAMAALFKGATMAAFGLWVIGVAGWHAWNGTLPHAFMMRGVGTAALLANAASFGLLWAYRGGDANMRSAWLCTRNDVLGNLAGARTARRQSLARRTPFRAPGCGGVGVTAAHCLDGLPDFHRLLRGDGQRLPVRFRPALA